ncbi:uncharacterized protein EI90DRAFT_3021208 [Cantharellus anzutake]|uniref:uncharacterized protein n=1 Tax=Cantharellus anzutake TaxID=1750568 RepID=UPI001903C0C3|nr:uncharacterized protein EI90DRAFT_3021208 [Cantharellus anzutake]KAF8318051.1 hypothetical protein EI90DRAFT_3021208 [Cantharellus anzutake]
MQTGSPEGPTEKDVTETDDELARELLFGLTGDDRYKGLSADANRYVPNVDIETAKVQRANAEGMEKVLTSLLTQRSVGSRHTHEVNPGVPGVLPNGVRIRIVLSALVNDLFARDQHLFGPDEQPENVLSGLSSDLSPMSIASIVASGTASSTELRWAQMDFEPSPGVPISLAPLTPISSFQQTRVKSSLASESKSGGPPARSIFSSIPRGAGMESPWALGSLNSLSARRPESASASHSVSSPPFASSSSGSHASRGPRVRKAVGRSRDLYNSGIRRCWPICAGHLTDFDECPPECLHAEAYAADKNGLLTLLIQRSLTTIGSGLPDPGIPLRSAIPQFLLNDVNDKGEPKELAISGTRMAALLPRFLRLSAFVARELGCEMREQRQQFADVKAGTVIPAEPSSSNPTSIADIPSTTGDGRPTRIWYALLSGMVTRAALEGYLGRGWLGPDALEILFGIGVGVDWEDVVGKPDEKDVSAMRARSGSTSSDVKSVEDDGVSQKRGSIDTSLSEAYAAQFEPDGMPTLAEAAKILFKRGIPTGVTGTQSELSVINSYANGFQTTCLGNTRPIDTDPEWAVEMTERVSEFASVHHTTDLHTHLLDLSKRYPAEPVERAALRFLEAIAQWRGLPELEQYKERVRKANTVATQPSASLERRRGSLSISSLVHPTFEPSSSAISSQLNTPVTSPVLKYFVVPKYVIASLPPYPSKKRVRDEGPEAEAKRLKTPRVGASSSATAAANTSLPGILSAPANPLAESSWTGPTVFNRKHNFLSPPDVHVYNPVKKPRLIALLFCT